MDFFGFHLVGARGPILRGDDRVAEGVVGVGGGAVGFAGVPGPGGAVCGEVVVVVAVAGVPADRQCLGGQAERRCAPHGAGGAVAGVSGAKDLFGFLERRFDGPAGGVSFDHLCGGGGGAGGDQGDFQVPARALHQDHLDGPGSGHRVPQAGERGGADGFGPPVAAHRDPLEPQTRGELRQRWQAVATQPGAASSPGGGRRQRVQGGVLAQPGGPGDAPGQALEDLPGVRGAGHDVDRAIAESAGQCFDHLPGAGAAGTPRRCS